MNDHPLFFRLRILSFARAAALALALLAAPSLHAATRTWDNGAGTNVWGTAANWSGDTLPATSDTVIINNGDTVYTSVALPALNITISGNSVWTSNVNATTGGVIRLGGSTVTVESGSSLSGLNFWDMNGATLNFYDGAIVNLTNWEFKANNTTKFILGASGFSTLTPYRIMVGGVTTTANQTYVVDFNNYTGGSTTLTLMDFSASSYSTLNATSFQSGNFSYLNNTGYSASMSYNDATFDIQLAITKLPSTWAGGSGNWSAGFSPAVANGDAVEFTGAGGTATNNIASGTLSSIGSILFDSGAGAYTLVANSGSAGNGSALTVTGAITNNSSSTQTINMDVAPGSIVINSGAIEIGASGRLNSGSYSNTISNSGTFIYSGTNAQTLSGVISGTGGLTKNASSTLTLSGANTYTGTTTVNAGTLTLGANQNLGAIAGAGALNLSSYTLTTNSSSSTTYSGVISGTGGSLTKEGTGTLTLSNTNTYSGSTTINAGTLQIDGNIANSGLVINSGAIISPGSTAAADSFGTSSITINGGGYNWTLNTANGSAGSGWDQITSTGALTSSGALTVYAYGTPGDWNGANSYSWDIISANSVSGFSAGNFSIDFTNFGIAVGNRTGTWSFSNPSGGIIRLSYEASGDPVWTGGTANWDTGFSPAVTEGDTIAFSGAGGTATNNISNGTLTTVNDIEFRNGAGAYTLAANAGSAGAIGGMALTVNGSIINNSLNTQTINMDVAPGSIVINTGALEIGAAGRLNSGSYSNTITNSVSLIYSGTNAQTLSGDISGTGALTKNAASTLTLTGNNTYSGATTINAGALEIGGTGRLGGGSYAGNIVMTGAFTYNSTADQTLSGIISGTGALTKNAASTLTLTGNNTYSGATTINAGTLVIDGAGRLGGGSYAGNITIGGAGALTYNSTADQTLSGLISGGGAFNKLASSTLTLSGSNTRSGSLVMGVHDGNLTAGAVKLEHNNALGTGGIFWENDGTIELAANGLTISNSNTIFARNSATDGKRRYRLDLASSNTGTFSGNFDVRMSGLVFDVGTDDTLTASGSLTNGAGGGGFEKTGAGTLVLTGATNTLNSNIVISAGTLQIGNGGTTGTLNSLAVTNNGSLVFNRSNALTVANAISGSGNVIKNASNTLTLTGSNSYTGATTINAGTLQITGAGQLGGGSYAGNITIGGAGVFTYNSTANQTLSGTISGAGSLNKLASSTLTLSGSNTRSGSLVMGVHVGNLTAGAVKLEHNNALGTGGVDWENDGTIELAANGLTISNSNNIFARNSATDGKRRYRLDLAGSNTGTFSGNFDIRMSGLVFDVGIDDTLTASGSLTNGAGGGGFEKTGAGTLVLTGSTNTLNGNIVISAGTLQIGNGGTTGTLNSLAVTNNGSLVFNRSNALTVANAISGSGNVIKNASNTLTLTGSNTYSGGTTLNTGTLVIGNAAAAGSGTITQTDGTSLLTFDTTGTIANAMSIYNVVSNQTVTLSGAITAQNTTYDVADGTTLSINGSIGGSGGVTKEGNGTLELNAANTFTGDTEINFGTLEANATGSLASTGNITVNGGSLLVGANNAINESAAMDLAGGTLEFNGNINETVGALTLSANSVIDMGGGNIALEFSNLVTQLTSTTQLKIYNYTLYSDHISFGSNTNLSDSLPYISFYSGFGTGFIGNSFIEGINPYEIRPVPEPETWATGILLVLGSSVWMWRKRRIRI